MTVLGTGGPIQDRVHFRTPSKQSEEIRNANMSTTFTQIPLPKPESFMNHRKTHNSHQSNGREKHIRRLAMMNQK